ncbi:uncharacterized protein LOC133713160 [Rosa rugosa]|uniref:uncharacterized protein LOC133713160 n=1 Tax=Rosa rugosa TaxID=74645 RepID=UPI002B406D9F|nr:uncharacterized protein LOC133713160 [Rosa rugosa]
MEAVVKSWHETSKVEARVYFLLDNEKTDTEKYAPVVNIDKAFESPDTHRNCFPFLRQYAEDSFSRASCLVTPKSIMSYPQVWKGQGSRKWKHGQQDGFFVQFETPFLQKLWFIPSSNEFVCIWCILIKLILHLVVYFEGCTIGESFLLLLIIIFFFWVFYKF